MTINLTTADLAVRLVSTLAPSLTREGTRTSDTQASSGLPGGGFSTLWARLRRSRPLSSSRRESAREGARDARSGPRLGGDQDAISPAGTVSSLRGTGCVGPSDRHDHG